jgi:hypothetical protein
MLSQLPSRLKYNSPAYENPRNNLPDKFTNEHELPKKILIDGNKKNDESVVESVVKKNDESVVESVVKKNDESAIEDDVESVDNEEDESLIDDESVIDDDESIVNEKDESAVESVEPILTKGLIDKPITIKNSSYLYLEDSILVQDYNITKYPGNTTVHLCMYKVNMDCNEPFLQFTVILDSDYAYFPKFQYQPQNTEDDYHLLFQNECGKELLQIVPLYKTNQADLLDEMYKGIIELETSIVVVYDITDSYVSINESIPIQTGGGGGEKSIFDSITKNVQNSINSVSSTAIETHPVNPNKMKSPSDLHPTLPKNTTILDTIGELATNLNDSIKHTFEGGPTTPTPIKPEIKLSDIKTHPTKVKPIKSTGQIEPALFDQGSMFKSLDIFTPTKVKKINMTPNDSPKAPEKISDTTTEGSITNVMADTVENIQQSIPVITPPSKYIWCILDEIIYKKDILGRKPDNIMIETFKSHIELKSITNLNNQEYDIPFSLYMAVFQDDRYHNTYNKDDMLSLIDEESTHAWFTDGHIYSTDALDKILDPTFDYRKLRRYVVFTKNAQYILKDISECSDQEKTDFLNKDTDKDVLTVYFQEKGTQLWYIYGNNWSTILD